MTTCARVLTGRDRGENERSTALRSYDAFESFHCRPGPEGAHDKGGLEGEVGRCRRCQFGPMPNVGSVEEPNELVAAGDRLDDLCRIDGWRPSVRAHDALERPHLKPVGEPFAVAPRV